MPLKDSATGSKDAYAQKATRLARNLIPFQKKNTQSASLTQRYWPIATMHRRPLLAIPWQLSLLTNWSAAMNDHLFLCITLLSAAIDARPEAHNNLSRTLMKLPPERRDEMCRQIRRILVQLAKLEASIKEAA